MKVLHSNNFNSKIIRLNNWIELSNKQLLNSIQLFSLIIIVAMYCGMYRRPGVTASEDRFLPYKCQRHLLAIDHYVAVSGSWPLPSHKYRKHLRPKITIERLIGSWQLAATRMPRAFVTNITCNGSAEIGRLLPYKCRIYIYTYMIHFRIVSQFKTILYFMLVLDIFQNEKTKRDTNRVLNKW